MTRLSISVTLFASVHAGAFVPAATSAAGGSAMLLDLGRAVSLILTYISLYALLDSAFFVPGTRWEDRLIASFSRVVLAACICMASGLLFRESTFPEVPLVRTLPVRLFLWTLLGASVLFALSWYLDVYYLPLLWRNQP
jgi:hypothetical protein